MMFTCIPGPLPETLAPLFGVLALKFTGGRPWGVTVPLPDKIAKKLWFKMALNELKTVEPLIAATALGVRITTSSPGRMSCRATLTRIAPDERSDRKSTRL